MAEAQRDTVAIVDDDEAVRHSLQFLLEVIGPSVETFASATEFQKAEPDKLLCLIVDQHMPGMTGLELAERLHAQGNTIPIMLVTGSPSPAIDARASELGIDGVLEKPPDEARLLAFIEMAKRRGEAVATPLASNGAREQCRIAGTVIGLEYRRSPMANQPVEVKRTTPAPTGAPDAWRSLRTEMDRLFDRFAGGWGLPSLRRMFDVEPAFRYESSFTMPSPAMDITEDDSDYKVAAELPGMSEKEIEVAVAGDTLTLKGEKRQEREQKEQNFYLSERSYGSFQRSFYVPEGVDRDKIAATFSNGVLTVTMPKTAKAAAERQKKIEVKAT